MIILQQLKLLLELENDSSFDEQILFLANEQISYLISNNVPLTNIDSTTDSNTWVNLVMSDIYIVTNFIYLGIIQEFDREISTPTINWINDKRMDLIHNLKSRYDV
jgi:hypothetical protein